MDCQNKMTKSIEEQAREFVANKICFNGLEYSIGGKTHDECVLSYMVGAKARDDQFMAVVNELREALNKSTEVLHEAYYEIDDDADEYKEQCIKNREVIIKADQMIENMGVKL